MHSFVDNQPLATMASRKVATPQVAGSNIQTMALQRSEFEDFMNAYRPTLEISKNEPTPRSSAHEDTKSDFGRSLKKLMKKNHSSPNVNKKSTKKESIQRVPLNGERSATNELRPLPTSTVKKASRPPSVYADSTQTEPCQTKPLVLQQDASKTLTKSVEVSVKNGSKTKAGKNSSTPEQQHFVPQECLQPLTLLTPETTEAHTPNEESPTSVERNYFGQDIHQQKRELPAPVIPLSTPTERDGYCLFVARNRLERFLPSRWNPDPLLSLRLVEVPERKYRVILEFEELPEFEKPKSTSSGLIATPYDNDPRKGSWYQIEAFSWIKENKMAVQGLLLINVERYAEFPFITYLIINGSNSEMYQKIDHMKCRPLPEYYQQQHFVAGYEETVTVTKPPIPLYPEKPSSEKSGYIVSVYQVLSGEDGLRFEQNWVMWTGARQLYSHVPDYMGLRRLSIHKSILPTQTIVYSMLCEFSHIMEYLTEACVLVDQLRVRCCGFIGIYRILDSL